MAASGSRTIHTDKARLVASSATAERVRSTPRSANKRSARFRSNGSNGHCQNGGSATPLELAVRTGWDDRNGKASSESSTTSSQSLTPRSKRKQCPNCWHRWLDHHGKHECPKCHHVLPTRRQKQKGRTPARGPYGSMRTPVPIQARTPGKKSWDYLNPRTLAVVQQGAGQGQTECAAGGAHVWCMGECSKCGVKESNPWQQQHAWTQAQEHGSQKPPSTTSADGKALFTSRGKAGWVHKQCPTCWHSWLDHHGKPECPKCHSALPTSRRTQNGRTPARGPHGSMRNSVPIQARTPGKKSWSYLNPRTLAAVQQGAGQGQVECAAGGAHVWCMGKCAKCGVKESNPWQQQHAWKQSGS